MRLDSVLFEGSPSMWWIWTSSPGSRQMQHVLFAANSTLVASGSGILTLGDILHGPPFQFTSHSTSRPSNRNLRPPVSVTYSMISPDQRPRVEMRNNQPHHFVMGPAVPMAAHRGPASASLWYSSRRMKYRKWNLRVSMAVSGTHGIPTSPTPPPRGAGDISCGPQLNSAILRRGRTIVLLSPLVDHVASSPRRTKL